MTVFELTIPNCNTWNGTWSGRDSLFIRTKADRLVPKSIVDQDFFYDFGDGWSANIHVYRMSAVEARKLERKSRGFMGYDWMIRSILKYGEIRKC